jgi:hypothetical protein
MGHVSPGLNEKKWRELGVAQTKPLTADPIAVS